jgi:hypothetical protein
VLIDLYFFLTRRSRDRRMMRDPRYAELEAERVASGNLDWYTHEQVELGASLVPASRIVPVLSWLDRHGPVTGARHTRHFWQRGRRGFSDVDLWSFDYYVSGVIRDGLRSISDDLPTHPVEMTHEQWRARLRHMADGFDAAQQIAGGGPDEPSAKKAVDARAAEALEMFIQDFFKLWT